MNALEGRIRIATKQVCGHTNGRTTLTEISRYKSCAKRAKIQAMQSIDPTRANAIADAR
jgi:UrcA family protein